MININDVRQYFYILPCIIFDSYKFYKPHFCSIELLKDERTASQQKLHEKFAARFKKILHKRLKND